jgi:hypothetical protein
MGTILDEVADDEYRAPLLEGAMEAVQTYAEIRSAAPHLVSD